MEGISALMGITYLILGLNYVDAYTKFGDEPRLVKKGFILFLNTKYKIRLFKQCIYLVHSTHISQNVVTQLKSNVKTFPFPHSLQQVFPIFPIWWKIYIERHNEKWTCNKRSHFAIISTCLSVLFDGNILNSIKLLYLRLETLENFC